MIGAGLGAFGERVVVTEEPADEVVDERGNSLIPPEEKDAVPANAAAFGNVREGNTSHWEIGATLHHPKGGY